MIPTMNIVAWGRTVPWVEQRQIEQDLIISRALVDLFGDPFLSEQLRPSGARLPRQEVQHLRNVGIAPAIAAVATCRMRACTPNAYSTPFRSA